MQQYVEVHALKTGMCLFLDLFLVLLNTQSCIVKPHSYCVSTILEMTQQPFEAADLLV